jgi:hypothetical protein
MSSKEIARYTFHVNSDKRSSGTNTDMILAVKDTITKKSLNSTFHIQVHNTNIPFSFYQLSSDIATLSCDFTDSTGNLKTANITLQPGNYTTVSVLTELSTKLIAMAQISSGLYVGFTPVLNFSYSTTTSKSTFAYTNPANTSIKMKFASNTNLGIFFGLSADTTISTVLTGTSSKVCVANPVNYLLVRAGNLPQTYNKEFIVETDVFSDIIYRIPVGTGQNTWIQQYYTSEPIQIAPDLITSLNIYLTTNLTYNPIDLQGLSWAFSFSIIEYENTVYTSVTKQLLSNIPPPPPPPPLEEDPVQLEKDFETNLAKLKEYQAKLTK